VPERSDVPGAGAGDDPDSGDGWETAEVPSEASSARLRWASTTAPTTAITSRTEVASKASRYRVNSDRASFSTLEPGPLAAPADERAPVAHRLPARNSTSMRARAPAMAAATRCPRRGSIARFSERSTPSSMMTNRKSTTMAPA